MRNARLWLGGGIAGTVSICCYLAAITVPFGDTQAGTSIGLLVASGFPILGIVYGYALQSFVAVERDGVANRLGFVFIVAAFATLLGMLLVQLAVESRIAEITAGLDAPVARAVRRAVRMVDLGLDVAWDLLGGVALVCWGLAMRRRSRLGPGWGIPLVVLGAGLIVLNAATFPTPPGDGGLIDLGPFAGAFMLALAVRLAWLGRHELAQAAMPA